MPGCCSCCNCLAFKPRWKRLVDNIFPVDPQDGLVRSNMEKLTFYALRSPEKLDRIGVYLAKRLSRDVPKQHKRGFVVISMEALDQLLVTCRAQSLNLFVESFLKMVQKLLESNDADLQVLATSSFVKFANIEEDTPSYHRRYDFFVSKFSAMCHYSSGHQDSQVKIRLAGLEGLRGVVRKTVSDDLQVNIWETQHMNKIIPSLLFNMQQQEVPLSPVSTGSPEEGGGRPPGWLAETCLRELISRATYSNIRSLLKPVLTHLDNHQLWVPPHFATRCFQVIMYSIQAQYAYQAINMLLSHMDESREQSALTKKGIVTVLAQTVAIAASGSIGPGVLEVFNTLLRHLRLSIDQRLATPTPAGDTPPDPTLDHELLYEEAIITTIGTFATILPDYQKIEIMMFIISKVPLKSDDKMGESDRLLQNMLLKSLLQVGRQYTTGANMTATLTPPLLDPLLSLSKLPSDPATRLLVQHILHTLLDRHGNLPQLDAVFSPANFQQELKLSLGKCSRQDGAFMTKNGPHIFRQLYECLSLANNRLDNYRAVYSSLALLCVELGSETLLVDLVHLCLGLQTLALGEGAGDSLGVPQRHALHALLASYLNLIGHLTAIPAFRQHIWQVIDARQRRAPYLLPEAAFSRDGQAASSVAEGEVEADLLFEEATLSEAMRSSGHDTSKLATPYQQLLSDTARPNRQSAAEVASIIVECDSNHSTPPLGRKQASQPVSFEALKRAVTASSEETASRRAESQHRILTTFTNNTLEVITAQLIDPERVQLQAKLEEILSMADSEGDSPTSEIPTYEMKFPQLYIY